MKIFGKKGEKCGIPHEFGSTGFGVAEATAVAAEIIRIPLKGAKIAIHGFGNVGSFAWQYLTKKGALVVGLADKSGSFYAKDGFDKREIEKIIKSKSPLANYKSCSPISSDEFWSLPVDILIPVSITDVINESNKDKIKAKIIVEAVNIPMSEAIEEELYKKGIFIVPDFVANAGGVISFYAEYRGYNPKKMFEIVKRKITKTAKSVLKENIKINQNPRLVALEIAKDKIKKI